MSPTTLTRSLPAILGSLLCGIADGAVRTPAELTAAVAAARPGEAIDVLPGTYNLSGPLFLKSPGPVSIRGVGRAEEVVLVGSGNREVVRVQAAGWSLYRLTLRGATGLVAESAASALRLEALRVTDASIGFQLGEPTDLVCALSGVLLANNVLAQIRGDAIQVNSVCDAQIYHQTVWGAARPLIVQGPSVAPRIGNNLWSARVPVSGEGDVTLPAPTFGTWFAAISRLDFHPLPGTPIVDTGALVPVTTDADGRLRPLGLKADVGAYELDPTAAARDMTSGSGDGGAGGAIIPGGGSSAGKGQFREGGFSCSAAPRPVSGPGLWAFALLPLVLRHRRASRTQRRP